jgi:hypothetical protein
MRYRRIAIGTALALVTLGGPTAGMSLAAEPADGTTTAAECTGHWPASVQGVPKQWHAGARAGDYIWHDARGWHLRVTHVGSRLAVFTGRIVSGAPMTVGGAQLEGRDRFTLSADKKVLTYRFTNYGHIDGLNITTDCAPWIDFGGSLNWSRLPVARIWIGANGVHPLQNPFVVRRVP